MAVIAVTCEVCGTLFDGHAGDKACNFYCFIELGKES